MAKKRKRAPGGGRKPNPNKKVMFSTRLEPDVMAALKAGAETFPGKSVSAFAEYLIDKGLQDRAEAERDAPLRALLYMIGQLGEKISGPVIPISRSRPADTTDVPVAVMDKEVRDAQLSSRWRTNPFLFKSFKAAVKKLLDALDEPKGEVQPPLPEAAIDDENVRFGSEDVTKRYRKALRNPEEFGVLRFELLWEQSDRTAPLSDFEKRFIQKVPQLGKVFMREFYSLPKARRALELNGTPEGNDDD